MDLIDNTFPADDQGSEAIYGFDYQAHCIARCCLEMALSNDVTETICEYHEDVVQHFRNRPARFCQVKKRESAEALTINSFKDAIGKLFRLLKYKDVGDLVIYGHGRPSANGACSLGGLITLLSRPADVRDHVWNTELEPYEQCICEMIGSSVDIDTVKRGLRVLNIDLTMPHPQGIEVQNADLLESVVNNLWGVTISYTTAKRIYDLLYKRVWSAHKKPKQPFHIKRITVTDVRTLLKNALQQEGIGIMAGEMLLTTNDKLKKGKLGEHLKYAIERRMDGLQIKYELEIKSTVWQDFRDDVSVSWEEFQETTTDLAGSRLWQNIRRLLTVLGDRWSLQYDNAALGANFAEGVFFDMVATCSVDIVA